MTTTQTQLSNVFNLMAQADIRIESYHFGWRWDINANIYNNFDPKVTKGRMFPAVMFDVPDEVSGVGEPQYLDTDEEIDMLLYFDTLQDYYNDGSTNILNLVEQWDALKTIASDFMANFVLVIGVEKYNIGSIVGGVKYVQKSDQHNARLLTWEVSFKLRMKAPCTEGTYQINLNALPATIQEYDMEKDSGIVITPCQAILAAMDAPTRCCVLKGYNFAIGDDTDFDCFAGSQISDLTTRLNISAPYENFYSMSFNGTTQNVGLLYNAAFDFERTNPFSFSIRFKYETAAELMFLMQKQQTTTPFRGYAFVFDPATQKFQFSLKSTVTTNEIRVDSVAQSLIIGTVYHITYTYDGSSTASGVNMYLDGVAIGTTTAVDNLTATTKSTVGLFFANWSTIYTQTQLNVGRLWNVALSPAQVTTDYSGGVPDFPVLPLNLIFDCKFGDGGLFSSDISRWLFAAIDDTNSFQSSMAFYGSRIAAI